MLQEQEQDVTADAQATDALLVRASKLDLLERLADDLAHEIKNPLHSMVINLEVLRRRVARRDADEQSDLQRYIGVLSTELERVNRRIELLLRMARPARSAEPATPDELVEEIMELLQLEGRKHEVEVRFEPAPQMARLNVPRAEVRQVLLDLVLEALDRIGQGGTLVLRTGPADGGVGIFLHASGGDGAPLSLASDTAGEERLAASRLVAERFGGRLHASPGADGAEGFGLVFSLPLAGS